MGEFCPPASSEPVVCTGGMYCGARKLSQPSGPCMAGWYCISGATTAHPPNGATGGMCPPGHYCVENTTAPVPCPPRYYNPEWGSADASACLNCEPGEYCPSSGGALPAGNCSAGYYCPASPVGQLTATPPEFRCPRGHSCPAGAAWYEICANGTYQDEEGQGQCKPCPAGSYCWLGNLCPLENETYTTPQDCPVGYYCPPMTAHPHQYPCPASTFNNLTGRSGPEDCIACPAGSYCATPGLSEPTGLCDAGYYCTGSAVVANPSAGATGGPCPCGHYCPEVCASTTTRGFCKGQGVCLWFR